MFSSGGKEAQMYELNDGGISLNRRALNAQSVI